MTDNERRTVGMVLAFVLAFMAFCILAVGVASGDKPLLGLGGLLLAIVLVAVVWQTGVEMSRLPDRFSLILKNPEMGWRKRMIISSVMATITLVFFIVGTAHHGAGH